LDGRSQGSPQTYRLYCKTDPDLLDHVFLRIEVQVDLHMSWLESRPACTLEGGLKSRNDTQEYKDMAVNWEILRHMPVEEKKVFQVRLYCALAKQHVHSRGDNCGHVKLCSLIPAMIQSLQKADQRPKKGTSGIPLPASPAETTAVGI